MVQTPRIGTATLEELLPAAGRRGSSFMERMFKGAGTDGAALTDGLPSYIQRAKGVVVGGIDDAAVYTTSALNSGATGTSFNPAAIPDGNDVEAAGRIGTRIATAKDKLAAINPLERGMGLSSLVVAQNMQPQAKSGTKPVGDAGTVLNTIDPVVSGASRVLDYAFPAQLVVDAALPALGGLAGMAHLPGVERTLNAPTNFLNPKAQVKAGKHTLGGKINDGIMIGFSALGVYGVAKGWAQNLDSLKHMYSDMTGVPMEKVSTMTVLTGKVPEIVAEARSHFLKEHLSRGALQAISLGLGLRYMLKGKTIPWQSMVIPQLASMGADMLMGESVLPVYSGFANAFKSGQPVPQEGIAEFVLASSKELKANGIVGRMVAWQMAGNYVQEKAGPGEILRQIEDGRFATRIKPLIETAKVEHAAEIAKHKAAAAAKAAHAHPSHAHHAHAEKPHSGSMVDKISGNRPRNIEVKGKFTEKLKQELSSPEQGVAPSVP